MCGSVVQWLTPQAVKQSVRGSIPAHTSGKRYREIQSVYHLRLCKLKKKSAQLSPIPKNKITIQVKI